MIECDDASRINQLLTDNALLKLRILDLESRLSFLSQHKTLAAGMSGEQLVSGLIGGVRTVHTASVDIIMDDGRKIEVKHGKLSYPSPNRPGNSARWQWGKIFGEKNAKGFDFIVLVGEADKRFLNHYKDPDSPYVIFMLTNEQAQEVVTAHTSGAKAILLGTNPLPQASKARRFFDEFQLTADELSQRVGL